MGSDMVARVDTDREQRWRGGVVAADAAARASKQAARERAHSERSGAWGVQLPLGVLSKACCSELFLVWPDFEVEVGVGVGASGA